MFYELLQQEIPPRKPPLRNIKCQGWPNTQLAIYCRGMFTMVKWMYCRHFRLSKESEILASMYTQGTTLYFRLVFAKFLSVLFCSVDLRRKFLVYSNCHLWDIVSYLAKLHLNLKRPCIIYGLFTNSIIQMFRNPSFPIFRSRHFSPSVTQTVQLRKKWFVPSCKEASTQTLSNHTVFTGKSLQFLVHPEFPVAIVLW